MEPLRNYLWTYAALGVLLVATVAVSYLPLGALGVLVALLIATSKALLVAMVFMHLRTAAGVTRIFALAGFFWLLILIGLTLADYLTRRSPDVPVTL